jgi:hypothetical protein
MTQPNISKDLIFNVAHLRTFTSAISASLFITEWNSLMYHCLPIMCSPCLFLYFSVYSKICLFPGILRGMEWQYPRTQSSSTSWQKPEMTHCISIYISCFTRFHSHSLHSTSSDDHSLVSHRTDDCAVCICEKVFKET